MNDTAFLELCDYMDDGEVQDDFGDAILQLMSEGRCDPKFGRVLGRLAEYGANRLLDELADERLRRDV